MFPNDTLKINESYNCPLCKEFLTGYQLMFHLVDEHEADMKNTEDYKIFQIVKSKFIKEIFAAHTRQSINPRLLNAVVLCHILGQETLGHKIIDLCTLERIEKNGRPTETPQRKQLE